MNVKRVHEVWASNKITSFEKVSFFPFSSKKITTSVLDAFDMLFHEFVKDKSREYYVIRSRTINYKLHEKIILETNLHFRHVLSDENRSTNIHILSQFERVHRIVLYMIDEGEIMNISTSHNLSLQNNLRHIKCFTKICTLAIVRLNIVLTLFSRMSEFFWSLWLKYDLFLIKSIENTYH